MVHEYEIIRLAEEVSDRVRWFAILPIACREVSRPIVESADHATLWRNPRHPYTRALLASIPSAKLDKRPAAVITGEAFPSADAGSGCVVRGGQAV